MLKCAMPLMSGMARPSSGFFGRKHYPFRGFMKGA
jgi:hypothetical protein